jgi:Resolvase, N terminal domain
MDQHFATRKCHFLGSLERRVQLGQAAPLYCRIATADQTCARQERDLCAFAKKAGYKIVGVWNEIAPGPKQERAEPKKVQALAQARTVDLILVTELTRWGRSATFAARSLTCFKFRFVAQKRYAQMTDPKNQLHAAGSPDERRFHHDEGIRKLVQMLLATIL